MAQKLDLIRRAGYRRAGFLGSHICDRLVEEARWWCAWTIC
jgi:hypothetical protein